MPAGPRLPESLIHTPPPYQPRNQLELVASDIAREVCRTMPMMQRLGAQDYEIQARLRSYIQRMLAEFATDKKD
jgi:hypothetical protein